MYAIEFVCEPMDNGAIQWTCVSTPLPKEIKLPVLISSPPLFRAHRMPTLPLYVPLCVPSFFACPSSVFPLFASLPRLFSCCFRPASASVNVLMQMCIFSMLGASMTVDRQFQAVLGPDDLRRLRDRGICTHQVSTDVQLAVDA